jgi:hypothetical protein
MSRSGLFNFYKKTIWLIHDWEWADLAYLILRMSRSGLFKTQTVFFLNRFGGTMSVIRDTRFGIGRTVPAVRDTIIIYYIIVVTITEWTMMHWGILKTMYTNIILKKVALMMFKSSRHICVQFWYCFFILVLVMPPPPTSRAHVSKGRG